MSPKVRLYISSVTALLFVILVFMNFIDYWQANPTIQILFFFIMVISIFNTGMEAGKDSKSKS